MPCLQRVKAKKTFSPRSLPCLREMPDGLPKSMCPNSEPQSPHSKKWIIFTLFGKWGSLRKLISIFKKSFIIMDNFFVEGTTLTHGENSHIWMKRKRKRLNGELI